MGDDGSAKFPTKKRKSISIEQKIVIIKKSEEREKLTEIGRRFGVSCSAINIIFKDKERIKTHVKDGWNIQQISACRRRPHILEEMEIFETEQTKTKEITLWVFLLFRKML